MALEELFLVNLTRRLEKLPTPALKHSLIQIIVTYHSTRDGDIHLLLLRLNL